MEHSNSRESDGMMQNPTICAVQPVLQNPMLFLSFFCAPLNIQRTKEEKTKEASVPNGLPVTEISEGYTKVKMEEK